MESSTKDDAGRPDDPASYGLLVAALFDKPVTRDTAEQKANYQVDANAVIGAQLQHSGRLAYLYLQKPVGALTPRSLTVTGIADERGQSLGATTQPIVMTLADGAHVFGQVRDAGGVGIGGGILKLAISSDGKSFDVAAIRTDAQGGFDFDFVARLGDSFTLTAQHPTTRDIASLSARIHGAGEQLLLNPTFLGRGTVRGRVLAPGGTSSVPDIPIALIPGSVLGSRGFQARTNTLGEFTFTDAPVGVFTLSAADGRGNFGQATGVIAHAGDSVAQDLQLVAQPDEGGQLVGRVFLADGATPGAGFAVYVGRYDRDHASIAAVDQAQTDAAGAFAFARTLPPGAYDVVAIDPASQQLGATAASVSARTTSSVSIVLESVGAVEGVVFNGRGERMPGALVAGGVALVTTDANGFFRIEGVPAGARTIEAGDPVTRRRGSAPVIVLPGQTVSASITLESRATIVGRVLDAGGHPIPGASVRIPQVDGFTFVIANNQGVFTFPDLTLGDYLLQAPGPSKEALISFMEANGVDPRTAFTSGDAPDGLTDPTVPPPASDANAVLAAYQKAVQTFFSVNEGLIDGLPIAGFGGFGWNRVQLFQDATTIVADVTFLPQGVVSGHTADSANRPTGATVRVSGLKVGRTGFPVVGELSRLNTDPATGVFSFGSIPRFDLATFQTAGVRGGDFTLEAASPFSPAHPQFRGQLSTATPNLSDIVLAFPAAVDTNGTVSGQVLLPDGVTPAPEGTLVKISFGDLTVTTDASGKFRSQLPIPSGFYTITAQATSGLRGQAAALVPAGGNVDIQLRLLGLGAVTVNVKRPNGASVPNALVKLLRATFPGDRSEGTTDANGVVRFVNLTEGPFSVTAEEAGTGLSGRSSAAIVRDGDVALPVTITASGVVTGAFVSADSGRPIAFAQIVLAGAGVQAYSTTDAAGRFVLNAIPVGPFSVEGFDAVTGRRGRATSQLQVEGQIVDVTILEVPRGSVTGVVVNADGVSPVAASRVTLVSSSFIETRLQATALANGNFRFDGVPAGSFRLEATDPVSGFTGSATGTLTVEGETVDINVPLAPFGSVHVQVLDAGGQPATNASVSIGSTQAAVDANGQFTFEHLALGSYHVVARSLADANDAGDLSVKVESPNQVVDASVRLRGVGSVTVTVVPSNGAGVVPSAEVTLTAKAAFGDATPGPGATTMTGFTNASGIVTFASVPVGDFFVKAEAAALAGVATGRVASPAAVASIQVQLGASGVVAGRVILPDGLTPAANAFVTLRFQSQTSLQSGVLQVTTGLTGAFEFGGIPLGTFTLSAIEVVSNGVRSASGTLSSDGQRNDLGVLTLDNAAPRILQVSPADRASAVAVREPIVITFNERVARTSINSGSVANVALREGSTLVPLQSPEFSADGRTLTLRPTRDLTSGALHTITVTGAPDGPKDEAGLALVDPFVSTFTVRDSIPPVVTSASPAGGAAQVPPDAVVRVTFSEPVIGATIAVRDRANVQVTGAVTLAVGGTVAIFTPVDFLRPNTSYTATVSNVADTAGNTLAGGTFTTAFSTIDTIAPTITALQLVGTPRVGATVSVRPTIADADVQRVEFSLGSVPARVATETPFTASLVMPANAPSTVVTAVAFDLTGNRSEPFTLPIAIQPNAPPTVTLTNVSGATTVAQGDNLSFDVRADDDDELAQIVFTAVGSVTTSVVRPVAAGQSHLTSTFTLQVPATTPSQSTITVQAGAVDRTGGQSQPAALTLNVRDAVRPTVAVLSPVNNALVVEGQTIDVVVDAADDVALQSVSLVCNPALTGCGSRALAPAVPSSHQTFSVQLTPELHAPQTVTLSIVATDTSGNTGSAGRILQILDTIKPTVAALESATGSTRIAAGSAAVLRATVSDNVGVTALTFSTEGGLTTSGTAPVTPALVSGIATVSIPIPAGTPNGSNVIVHVRARDAAGNLSDEASLTLTIGDAASPTLTILEPADGASVAPGGSITVRASATDDVAIGRFTMTASGVLTAADARDISSPSTPAAATFVVAVPAATPAGTLTIAVEAFDTGGRSSGPTIRTVNVTDIVAPVVQITGPAENAAFDPRTPIAVAVSATDAVGVTSMAFAASGTVSAAETRAVAPAATSRAETFAVFVTPLPARGGTLTLNATARDAAGNEGSAAAVSVRILDVVAPVVTSTDPPADATGVDRRTAIVVRFSEPMDRATLTTASIQLRRGATIVPTSLVIGGDDDVTTVTPVTQPLAANATFTIVVSTAVRDRAGNALVAEFASAFTTASPDTTPPKVTSVDPSNNAVDVSLATPITVTFSEAIDPASVTAQSFRVHVDATPIAGTFSFLSGNTIVRFTPGEPLPTDAVVATELTGAITDTFANALVATDGSALTTPLTFTFLTGRFSLTSPAGSQVVENSPLLLEARASAALGVTSVVFTVNGQAQPSAAGPPFTRTFNVGSAATTPSLTIVASARDGSGTEIATDRRTVSVVVGLQVAPSLTGVAVGGTSSLRFSLSSPLDADLPISLAAGDPTLVTFPANPAVIAAGQTTVDAVVTGVATGATAVIGSSSHGQAAAIVAVSPPQPGQTLTPFASPVGLAISNPPAAGVVILQSGASRTVRVALLNAPATTDLSVSILSTNTAVATAIAGSVAAGQLTADLQITALANGTATLILRTGDQVRGLTIFVGAPPAGSEPLVVAAPVGLSISNPPNAGQVIASAGRQIVLTVQLLNVPATVDTPVSVSTANAAVATATNGVIHAGQTTATITINTIADGTTALTLRAGGEIRSVTIFVGTPPAGATPLLVAAPVGVSVAASPSIGRAFAPLGVVRTLVVRLFTSPTGTDTPVTVSTSDASVASVSPAVVVRAGEQNASLEITTGSGGTATLTLEAAGIRREFTVVVGSDPTPSTTPVIVAAPVGVSVIPNPSIGRVFGQPGTASVVTLRIPLFDAPLSGPTLVTITSSNTAVVTLGGAATSTISLNTGDQVLQLPIAVSGAEGAALLTLEFDGQRRELIIVVGNPPASEIPAVTAPVVGIRIG